MSLVSVNWKPTHKELRDFGKAALFMLTAVALLLHWIKGLQTSHAIYVCAAGLLIYALSCLSAKLVKPIYITLQLLTVPIGWVVSYLIMAVFYYLVLTPIGLFFRLFGRDPLHRNFDPKATTYWARYRMPDSPKRYFNQF